MTALDSPNATRLSFLEILAAELAPREGRWAAVLRMSGACALTVAIAMTFKIPQPTYMAYIVFVITKDDRSGTLKAGLGGWAAVTAAVLVTLVFAQFDLSEPALRVPAMAALTFCAMYSTRTFALGPLTYLIGFVVVLLHSLIDDVPRPEAFLRATLWVWVIVSVPVAVTLLTHALFGHDLAVTTRRTLCKVLEDLRVGLLAANYQRRLAQWRGSLAPLLESTAHRKKGAATAGSVDHEALAITLETLTVLEVVPPGVSVATREYWARQLVACLRALDARPPDAADSSSPDDADPAVTPSERTVSACLGALREMLSGTGSLATPPPTPAKRTVLVADAFSNPTHWQFALKTTIAVMVCYATYTLLNWPGMRTAIVTCFFVALSSLGETVHKLILRLSGATIGGLLAGLCIVFVLPHLTDIGQLCALVALVGLLAGWVATSSELLAYCGLQIAFAFFLGVLQGYAPATDLTVLRDRVAGILLGNVVVTIVFGALWPESTRTALRTRLATVLNALGAALMENSRQKFTAAVEELTKAERLEALSALELRMLASRPPLTGRLPQVADVERLAGATFVAMRDAPEEGRLALFGVIDRLNQEVAHAAPAAR